ncbi:MAG: RIP metalloprotease RseP [Methylococcaceae bacterium]|nr:RIP metalloprotease RseP [Methylococcaceae bacterium]
MQSFGLVHTVFYFLLALGVLVAFHEFGHFYACRKLGVKVLRFSIGIGKSVWRYRKSAGATEFSIGALPFGGNVKMLDEREGEVEPADLPSSFNRQSLAVRSAIVVAGPLANFLLAILLYWIVFMVGEVGIRPVLGPIAPGTLAQQAGFAEGDEILAVGDETTPTWNLAIGSLIEQAMDQERLRIAVRTAKGEPGSRILAMPRDLAEHPEILYERLGFHPWQPPIPPIVGKIEPESVAEKAGLLTGDRLLTVDGEPVGDWQQWVEYVRARPGKELVIELEREGSQVSLKLRPAEVDSAQGKIGRVGVANAPVPEAMFDAMQVEYRLPALPALSAAISRTYEYSALTLKMMGRMLIGRVSVDNLSGPIGIAQSAGQSARLGYVYFLKFMAIVSVSLGVLNLLPVPVLDGGHLLFYLIEGVRGRPLSERVQLVFQNIGIVILFSLMIFTFYLDIMRHPA